MTTTNMPVALNIADISERFLKCNTATIYDVMDRMGYPHQCLDLTIRGLDRRMRIAGPAFTVRGTREPRFDDNFPRPELKNFGLLKAITPGSVVVINAEKDMNVGHWGEMMSLTARQHGAVGAVIDGGTRDMESILNIPDWSLFAKYTSPIESKGRWRSQEFGAPIFMTGTTTSEVLVRPGDFIVGDGDGIMVIPHEIVMEVLEKTEVMEINEEGTRKDLLSGDPIDVVYKRYGRL
ncbi:RraA family protein [Paenibacillus piri]|uniref:Putative 4-hydroxy-4-methyl-2-oxoglutarate aldolase n=1 Tax=Paenibacillus piri TaxID=2547395 RepID=A0A4R5KXC4_9BACL|nr:RraA family protein [Paenibacillus piri]TDG00710.1 RraA family protein [Paenibacillus piri]